MVQLLKKGFAALVAVLVGITAFAQVTTSLFLEPPWSRFTSHRVHSIMLLSTPKVVMRSTVCVQVALTRLR